MSVTTVTNTTPYINSTKTFAANTEFMPTGAYWFLNSIMVLTTIAGLTGNGLITYFFASKKIKITPFNLMLLNLSIADLLADIFAYLQIFVELKMLRNFSNSSASIVCAFTIGITPYGVVVSVSTLTLAYISFNRFMYVRYPFKARWFKSRRIAVIFLVIIWVISISYLVPNVFAFRYEPINALCYREWPEIINVNLWSISGMFLGVLLPVTVMLLTFFATRRHFKKMLPSTSSNDEATKKKKRTVRLLGFLILAFFLCMTPPSIYLLLSISFTSIWPPGVEGEHLRMIIIRVTFAICLFNTVADPIIYGYNNKEFQGCFNDVLTKLRCKFIFRSRVSTYSLENKDTSKTSEAANVEKSTKEKRFSSL